MNRRSLLLGISGAAMIAAIGGIIASRPGAQTGFSLPANAEELANIETLPDIAQGAADAPVTVVEYASYTCPHCATWHKEIYPRLKAEFIDTGKVRFIHREVYFEKFGLWAGLIAGCGGDLKYHAISGMIYDSQQDWIGDGTEATIAANLRKIGLKAGLGQEQIEACMTDQKRMEAMVATYQKNATADDINATPTLVINGEKFSNMPWEELKTLIEAKL